MAGTVLFDLGEKLPVGGFEFILEDGAFEAWAVEELPADVVYADEDAEYVGLVVEVISLPAVFEVADSVAGDAAVDDIEVVSGVFG